MRAVPVVTERMALEAQHQREMVRIHELWQQTKHELAGKTTELHRLQKEAAIESSASQHQRDSTVSQLQILNVELRDKLRFTELQLAGAREEGSALAVSTQELRTQLSDALGAKAEQELETQRTAPLVLELQAGMQRLGREKQALLDQLHEMERHSENMGATKERTLQLTGARYSHEPGLPLCPPPIRPSQPPRPQTTPPALGAQSRSCYRRRRSSSAPSTSSRRRPRRSTR